MTALVWDQVGERVYQTGVDRGVLYLPDGNGVPWNGLVSVEDTPSRETSSFYLDGIKYLERHSPGDFSGKLTAFTYPDEFDLLNGMFTNGNGMFFTEQSPKAFGLSYRTLLGDDIAGTERGYKLHLLYNLLANPDAVAYNSIGAQTDPISFGWTLTGTPVVVSGVRPTAHVYIDSTKLVPGAIDIIEATLYGSETTAPTLPPLSDVITLLDALHFIEIIDNGDGTWTANGPDSLITMLTATTFQITHANATYLDANTYEISNNQP